MNTEVNRSKNNQVTISGIIAGEFKYSHSVCGEGFYIVPLETQRASGEVDTIKVMVSERLVRVTEHPVGETVTVYGQFRSYNKRSEDQNNLILTVFALTFKTFECNDKEELEFENHIVLEGYICKKPVYRVTPLRREIADVLLAVNRPYGKSDYIPCICWGRNAVFADGLEVGTKLRIVGRIQSRNYQKKLPDNTYETRTAYEVSAATVELV